MKTRLDRVIAVRTGGDVERCHGIRHSRPYSVAAHTWGVLALLHELWPEDFPRVAATVLYHDVPEAWIGDIPAPTKRYDQSVKEACDSLEKKILSRLALPCDQDLSAEDAVKVKCCDHLELYLWAREQVYEGNGHATCVIRELDRFFEESPPPEPGLSLLREIRYGSIEHHTDRLKPDRDVTVNADGSVSVCTDSNKHAVEELEPWIVWPERARALLSPDARTILYCEWTRQQWHLEPALTDKERDELCDKVSRSSFLWSAISMYRLVGDHYVLDIARAPQSHRDMWPLLRREVNHKEYDDLGTWKRALYEWMEASAKWTLRPEHAAWAGED